MNSYDEKMGGFFTGAAEMVDRLVEIGSESEKMDSEYNKMMLEKSQEVREIDGIKYRWDGSKWVLFEKQLPKDDPVPGVLKFFTLDGLTDYINANPEGLLAKDEKAIVHVVDEDTVLLLSNPAKYSRERHVIARADAHAPTIYFGDFMDTERFNTMLLSTFHKTEERESVFKVVKSMTKQQTVQTTDDGVTQNITVKEGVATASNVQFKNPVPLKPMRTFTEIDQPISNFTLRVDEKAHVALHESDGGAWKNEAVARIAAYLKKNIKATNVVVIA